MFNRIIDLSTIIERKSVFLFGPRQTGKSFYLKNRFMNVFYYDLMKIMMYDLF